MPECGATSDVHVNGCDEESGKLFPNQILELPPPPSYYDRRFAMRSMCKPENVMSSFLAAQLRYIENEIYESDLRPLSKTQPSTEDHRILEYVISHEFE